MKIFWRRQRYRYSKVHLYYHIESSFEWTKLLLCDVIDGSLRLGCTQRGPMCDKIGSNLSFQCFIAFYIRKLGGSRRYHPIPEELV
uniref:Uncharacterized protein n=1 Tax=Pararge aegeria TaxID=116150 RepID=S4PDA3_9NEOP